MLSFNISGVVLDGPSTELRGLSAVEFVNVNGAWLIAVAAEADGALTSFGFENNAVTGVLDSQTFVSNSGTRLVWDLTIIDNNGTTVILPTTRYENNTEFYKLYTSGQIPKGIDPSGLAQLNLNTAVNIGGTNYVYATNNNGSGIVGFSVASSLDFTQVDSLADTGATYLGDVSALTSANVGGTEYLIVTSAYDAGISSYSVSTSGALTLADTVTPGDFSGFWLAQDLISMEVGGVDYVIMASAGTSSLTVYSISAGGALFETDYLIDSLDTRLQNASVLESFEYGGRSFVIAAGSDDGITVLELQSNGHLWEHASLADTYDITLNNVTSISAEVINGEVEILVGSGSDHGFTHITLDTTLLDSAITGSEGADVLNGSASADVIYGLGGNDQLVGGAGADMIVDGAGIDFLTGGGGRDVFVFVEDGDPDVIVDFQLDYDQIDLSQFSGISNFSQLVLRQWCDGVIIEAGNDMIIVQDTASTEFMVSDILASDFIF